MAAGVRVVSPLLLQLVTRRIERVTLGALVVCLAAASLQWLVLPRIEQHTRSLQGSLIEDPLGRSRLDDNREQAERYRVFRERLAESGDRSEWLKIVFSQAAATGIRLPQGDYSLIADTDGSYDKLQIVLPIKGTYQQTRSFASALLEKLPALALDEITFRRDNTKNPTVEALLRLTLYLKDAR